RNAGRRHAAVQEDVLRKDDRKTASERTRSRRSSRAGGRASASSSAPVSAEAALFGGLPPLLSERPGYLLWRIALRSRELIDQALEPLGIRARTFGLLA